MNQDDREGAVLRGNWTQLEALRAEVDRLTAENERAAAGNDLLLQISNQHHDRFHACLAQLTEKTTECDQFRAEAQALKADAERYRWLRGRLPGSAYRIAGVIYSEGGEGVDAGIDAAMKESSL